MGAPPGAAGAAGVSGDAEAAASWLAANTASSAPSGAVASEASSTSLRPSSIVLCSSSDESGSLTLLISTVSSVSSSTSAGAAPAPGAAAAACSVAFGSGGFRPPRFARPGEPLRSRTRVGRGSMPTRREPISSASDRGGAPCAFERFISSGYSRISPAAAPGARVRRLACPVARGGGPAGGAPSARAQAPGGAPPARASSS